MDGSGMFPLAHPSCIFPLMTWKIGRRSMPIEAFFCRRYIWSKKISKVITIKAYRASDAKRQGAHNTYALTLDSPGSVGVYSVIGINSISPTLSLNTSTLAWS